MKRRDVFGVTAALTAGLVSLPSTAHAAPEDGFGRPGDAATILADHLLRPYENRRSLIAVGHAVRQDVTIGKAGCPSCLSDAIDSLLHRLEWSEADIQERSSAAIRDRIREKTARDFAGDRVLPVRGWLLSETEIKLCAIASFAEVPLGY